MTIKQCEARGSGNRGKSRMMRIKPIKSRRHLRRREQALLRAKANREKQTKD